MPLEQERAERERLRGGPINALARFEHALAIVQEPLDRAMHVKSSRNFDQAPSEVLQGFGWKARLSATRVVHVLVRSLDAGPAAVEPVGLVGLVALGGLELAVELRPPRRLHSFDFGLGHHA